MIVAGRGMRESLCSKGWGTGGRVTLPTNKKMQWNIRRIPQMIDCGAKMRELSFPLLSKGYLHQKRFQRRGEAQVKWYIRRCLLEKSWEKYVRKKAPLIKVMAGVKPMRQILKSCLTSPGHPDHAQQLKRCKN